MTLWRLSLTSFTDASLTRILSSIVFFFSYSRYRFLRMNIAFFCSCSISNLSRRIKIYSFFFCICHWSFCCISSIWTLSFSFFSCSASIACCLIASSWIYLRRAFSLCSLISRSFCACFSAYFYSVYFIFSSIVSLYCLRAFSLLIDDSFNFIWIFICFSYVAFLVYSSFYSVISLSLISRASSSFNLTVFYSSRDFSYSRFFLSISSKRFWCSSSFAFIAACLSRSHCSSFCLISYCFCS
jgi:hypothetical protein